MSSTLIANAFSLTLLAVSLIIVVHSYYLYARAPSSQLFIVGLSMAMIALTALTSFAVSNVTGISRNLSWFNYIGQTISFLFLLLSLTGKNNSYLHQLMRLQIVTSLFLLLVLLITLLLPPFPPLTLARVLLSSSRGLCVLLICIHYIRTFCKQENYFNLLMSVACFLISSGYFTIVPKLFHANMALDRVGDILRILGLLILLVAIMVGEPARTPDEEKTQSTRVSLNRQRALNSKQPLKKDTKHAKV